MKDFAEKILKLYKQNGRDLPWRQTKDPYKIWLSEIIMQQTQISQGTGYYLKFVERFPTVDLLAEASEQEVLLLWQGLGYYTRARNLHYTAKEIVDVHNSVFPNTYDELLKLRGVGEYTASAISSICFNEPIPAIDGNVLRVISRIFEIYEPIDKSIGKGRVKEITTKLISKDYPGDFNQALMDFGSQVCKPKNPACDSCIFNDLCLAYKSLVVKQLPIKGKSKKSETEYYYYFIYESDIIQNIVIKKRNSGIWKNLYEFPKVKSIRELSDNEIINHISEEIKINNNIQIVELSQVFKHILSHKTLYIKFINIKLFIKDDFDNIKIGEKGLGVKIKELKDYPFPIIIRKYIDSKYF